MIDETPMSDPAVERLSAKVGASSSGVQIKEDDNSTRVQCGMHAMSAMRDA